jgi:hypothetical protein
MTRAESRWKAKPGGWDALNTSLLFPSGNALGIPDLLPAPLAAIPDYLTPYRTRIRRRDVDLAQVGVHFWTDDYRFETVWNRPRKALQALARYRVLLAPDFSIYRNWPPVVNQWNIYRGRWCGRFWQAAGFQVIPTVSWGLPEAWEVCLLGLPRHSVLGTSSIGTDLKDPSQREAFVTGFGAMVERLEPTAVICYGTVPDELHRLVRIVEYPSGSRWSKLRARQG